jgi:predicted RNA-binding protein with RPS1 domain
MDNKIENMAVSEIENEDIMDFSNEVDDSGYETKRTIDEVLDMESGEIIKSVDYFKLPEDRLIADRRRLQEAIAGFSRPKYVCAYCRQLVKLSGRATRRGQVSFFAHLYDSDDCEIKTNGTLSKEEIEERKYSNIQESERHILLKNKMADFIETTPDVTHVEIEKRITSDVPYLYWRKPDVFAEYNGKNIVFELQLSTTFLSVVVDRDIFYRMNNIFIVWVFNFSDNQEYVNLDNLMCKDIYYANKRNAFVFDDEAQRLSEETGELHLLCKWFEPIIENGIYKQGNDIKKEKYIKLSDLQFDKTTYKPYYVDADSLFAPFQRKYFDIHSQEYSDSIIELNRLIETRLRKLTKKRKEKEDLQKVKEKKIKEIREQINKGIAKLQLFQKKDKWGYECNGITIVEPSFSEATEISDEGFAIVQKRNKSGLINQVGDIILNCDYKELIFAFINQYIVNRRNEWFCINIQTKKDFFIHTSKNKDSSMQIERVNDVAYIVRIEDTVGILHETFLFRKYNSISNFGTNGLAIAERGGRWENGCSIHNGSFWEYTPKKYIQRETVYIEIETGEELIYDVIEIRKGIYKGRKFDKWGIETDDKKNVIPFEYDEIGNFVEGKAKAKKNGEYGYIDEQGNTIIPLEYDKIEEFIDGKAKAGKNKNWGYIDEQGNTIIPFEYDKIEEFINGKAKTRKNGKCGIIDEQGNIIIPIEYDEIFQFYEGKALAKKWDKYGYIDEQGNIMIPFDYNGGSYKFVNGKTRVKKNRQWGLIDEQGNTIVPFEYDYIESFVNGKAKAKKGWEYGYIDYEGNLLIHSEMLIFDNLIKGEKFGKWGIQDICGNIIIPFEYDDIGLFVDGKAKVKKDGKYGYIDKQGKIIIPFEYNEIFDFIDGKAKAKKDGKYGYIDEQGNEQIEDKIFLSNGLIKGKKFGKWGIKDTDENIIIPFEYAFLFMCRNKIVGGTKLSSLKIIDVQGINEQSMSCVISGISDFGVFLNIGHNTGLLHINEIKKANKAKNDYHKGDMIDVYIASVDVERKRISFSILPTKQENKKEREVIHDISIYEISSVYKGKVSKIVSYGLFITLEDGITALLHVSELKKHNKSCAEYKESNEIVVKVLSIDNEKNWIVLTLPDKNV